MKATGIVRRIDDLGRVVIPKEIRRSTKLHEGDPLEFFVEGDSIILKKYCADGEAISGSCADWVNKNKNIISSVFSMGDKTICTFKKENISLTAEVNRHNSDIFDLNVAICYCAVKCGFYVEGI
jgi:AbrB family looped-hinge helix DNA binding protein